MGRSLVEVPVAGRLRAKQIPTLRPGRHGDGGTLFLVVEPRGRSRHWVQRLTVEGKRRDLGLGGTRTSGSPMRVLQRSPTVRSRAAVVTRRPP